MNKQVLLDSIITDLADNYKDDKEVVNDILDDVITSALFISNRHNTDDNLKILSIDIKKAVKGIYLLRGTEGSKSSNEIDAKSTFDDVIETMKNNIVKSGKRIVF